MKRYLITGCAGFVSRHFLDYLGRLPEAVEIWGIDLRGPAFPISNDLHWRFNQADMLETAALEALLETCRPDYILHLASFSSVAASWSSPIASFNNNTNIFLNLLEALRKLNLKPRLLSIGSSEEYGPVDPSQLPLLEDTPLNPNSPYAVARVAQEQIAKVYAAAYGMEIVLTRSFNHFGPAQEERFAVASFAKRLVAAGKQGAARCRLETGDTAVVRDFLDVRDVAAAYYLLLQKGRSGEVYNVCSGRGVALEEIITQMAGILGLEVETAVNPALLRPNELPAIIGSNRKLRGELGWSPRYTQDQSLRDLLEYLKEQ